MDVYVKRRFNATIEDVVLVKDVQGEDDVHKKLANEDYEPTDDVQLYGESSTVEILQIAPVGTVKSLELLVQ